MKKFFMYCGIAFLGLIGFIALIPVIGILISGLLVAAGLHFYTASKSVFTKVLSMTVVIAGLVTALSNIPGLVGILALAIAYYIYKSNKGETAVTPASNDPFTNFEKEWANLNN